MKRIELRTVREIALGQGTRPQGFLLGVVEADDDITHDDLVTAAWDAESTLDLGRRAKVDLAGDTSHREVLCALRSPNVEFIEQQLEPKAKGQPAPKAKGQPAPKAKGKSSKEPDPPGPTS